MVDCIAFSELYENNEDMRRNRDKTPKTAMLAGQDRTGQDKDAGLA